MSRARPTTRQINALRARQQRNLLATLLLSQGVPMILGGDEIGRTQQGNNNGYCQDNEISWYDWDNADPELLEFTSASWSRLRREHPTFRRRQFFQGRALHGAGRPIWRGSPRRPRDDRRGVGRGRSQERDDLPRWRFDRAERCGARQITDTDVLWLINADADDVDFVLPDAKWGAKWRCVLDTETGEVSSPEAPEIEAGGKVRMIGRSLMLLVHVDDE